MEPCGAGVDAGAGCLLFALHLAHKMTVITGGAWQRKWQPSAHPCVIFSSWAKAQKRVQECTCISLSRSLCVCICVARPGAALKIRSKYANLSLQLQRFPLSRPPPNAAKCISYKVILHMAAGPGATHHLVMAKNVISGCNWTDKIQRSRVCIRFQRLAGCLEERKGV